MEMFLLISKREQLEMERPSLWSLPQEITQPLVCQQMKNTYLSLDILNLYLLPSFPPGSSDYNCTTQILSFISGQTIGTRIPITIRIVNDSIAESNKSFFGSLLLHALNVSVSPDEAEIFITDNDMPC